MEGINFMSVNKNEYCCEIRTAEENKRFLELLKAAEDNLNQAISEITYSEHKGFENINSLTETAIKNIIKNISRVKHDISSGYEPLCKPVKNKAD